jgi:hypothetical protein
MSLKLIALALVTLMLSAADAGDNYPQQVEHWRAEHQKKLAADFGWLTVVGLDWLQEGDNRVGVDPSSQVPLPSGSAPPQKQRCAKTTTFSPSII